jgi:outer membrane protein assembly factor BamA
LNEQDKTSPPSWLGAAGALTNNGTRGLILGGRLYAKENKYQTTFAVGKGRANLDFFGIGRIPGRPPISVPLSVSGTIFFGEAMRNIGKNVFVGPRFQYRRLSTSIDGDPVQGGFVIPDIDLKSNSAALGFHIQRDLRDSTFYPTKGTLFDLTADFFDQAWGGRREYQTYKIAYNGFRKVGARQVIAYRAMACSANGSVPFYDLCLYGFNNDLRGYTTGEFQNRRMFATQAEYRRELPKRLGVVAFGGIGGVARRWGDFRSDQLLPAAGAGLRFKLDKKNHINYRIDFAVGREEGRTFSIGVGEAF